MTTPTPFPSSSASAAPMPPLPELSTAAAAGGSGSPTAQPPGVLSSLLMGIAPVKQAVDQINAACQQIVQSGTVPGSEQICAQIVSAANSLLPMAAQNALAPLSQMQGIAAGPGGRLSAPPLPPGAPPPVGGMGMAGGGMPGGTMPGGGM